MPLTAKGEEIKGAMTEQYGEKKGEQVFYASKNKGTIEGVDNQTVGTSQTQDPPNWAMDKQPTVVMARDQARMAGAKDDWSPEAREAALEARRAHSGGGGGAGPAGHQQLHQKLTASGSQHRETETHHVWTNPKAGTQTEVSKKSGPTNKEPEGAKPWYHKVEAEHGKSREGPGGSRITGSGFQQRQWQAPKPKGEAEDDWSPEAREAAAAARRGNAGGRETERNIKRDLRPAHEVARAYGRKPDEVAKIKGGRS